MVPVEGAIGDANDGRSRRGRDVSDHGSNLYSSASWILCHVIEHEMRLYVSNDLK